MTSDAAALPRGAADRVIGPTRQFAACFTDARNSVLIEHEVVTPVMQRVVGIALGYEAPIDHVELRHDPVLARLVGKLAARRSDCAPLAGKSTLNRLELSRPEPSSWLIRGQSRRCSSIFSSTHTPRPRSRLRAISTPPTIRCTGIRRGGSSTATMIATAVCCITFSAGDTCWRRSCGARTRGHRTICSKLHAKAARNRRNRSCPI